MTAQKTILKNSPQTIQTLLPVDANAALRLMVDISEKLLALGDAESKSLIQKDMVNFALLQNDKEQTVARYVQASKEFRDRLRHFSRADKSLLKRLESAQTTLADQARANNMIVLQLKQSAEAAAKKSIRISKPLPTDNSDTDLKGALS
jgi:leucyl aminopeptidase (aminopeptidase T)